MQASAIVYVGRVLSKVYGLFFAGAVTIQNNTGHYTQGRLGYSCRRKVVSIYSQQSCGFHFGFFCLDLHPQPFPCLDVIATQQWFNIKVFLSRDELLSWVVKQHRRETTGYETPVYAFAHSPVWRWRVFRLFETHAIEGFYIIGSFSPLPTPDMTTFEKYNPRL